MAKPRGYVLYRGPSLVNGEPIVVVATMVTSNRKTGQMIQIWILPLNVSPVDALKTGYDVAVCGDCKFRGKGCYVVVFQAPRSIWAAYHRGVYAISATQYCRENFAKLIEEMPLRIGAYGDPMAVPPHVWEQLLRYHRAPHTGYTHLWQREDGDRYRDFLMASVDTQEEGTLARKLGWRMFRTIPAGCPTVPAGHIECPAEAGLTVCADCGLCNGARSKAKHIVIRAHGAGANHHPDA